MSHRVHTVFSLNIFYFRLVQITPETKIYCHFIIKYHRIIWQHLSLWNLIFFLLNLNCFSLLITCLCCNSHYRHFSFDNSQTSITSDNFVYKDSKINRVSLNSSNLLNLKSTTTYYDECLAAYKQKNLLVHLEISTALEMKITSNSELKSSAVKYFQTIFKTQIGLSSYWGVRFHNLTSYESLKSLIFSKKGVRVKIKGFCMGM